MTVQEFEIKNKIVSFLRRHETGASASDIAKSINHNRITIGKYLQVLRAEQIVVSKKVASALYWQLADFSRKFKILIVDDEKNIVDLVRLSLTSGRYDIYEAYDGLEAMNMIQKIIPDLIVLDLMMPIMDGLTVCKQLKSNVLTRSIPIIILSAKGEIKEKMQLLEIGVDDYITKPFDPLELEARVANKIRKKENLFSQNSITGLPSNIVTIETRKLWSKKTEWYELKIKILNFEEFTSIFGHKKSFETLMLLSRLIISSTKEEEIFIGHKSDYELLMFSENPLTEFESNLISKFKQIIPFIYTEQSDSLKKGFTKIKILGSDKVINHEILSLETNLIKHV